MQANAFPARLSDLILSSGPRAIGSLALCCVTSVSAVAALIWALNLTLNTIAAGGHASSWQFGLAALLGIVSFAVNLVPVLLLSERVTQDLRFQLAQRVLATPLSQLEQIGMTRVFASMTEDVITIRTAIRSIPSIVSQAAVLLGTFTYLFWISARTAALALALTIAVSLGVRWLLRNAHRRLTRGRALEGELLHSFRGVTEGTKELKLNSELRDGFLSKRLAPAFDAYRREGVRTELLFGAAYGTMQVMYLVMVGFVLFVAPSLGLLSIEVLIAFVMGVTFAHPPAEGLLISWPMLQRANVALERLNTLGLSSEGPRPALSMASKRWSELELRGVVHHYREDNEVGFAVGPVSLTLHPREIVFWVGGNGSGKTTLSKVLTGLYTPDAGEILLDGTAVTDANIEGYRQMFSTVFSDFFLFPHLDGTPGHINLDQAVGHYLESLRLQQKVRITNGGFSTTQLSQGQRKRLALLVSYLEDRPIYVFDEWAADQDPEFKAVFYEKLLPEMKAAGKTVVVISHDDRYFHLADRVMRFEAGRLVSSPQMQSVPAV